MINSNFLTKSLQCIYCTL